METTIEHVIQRSNKHTELIQINNATKQYEKTLDEVGKNVIRHVKEAELKNNKWHLYSDLEVLKRKISEVNTKKFVEFQIKENVLSHFNIRN